jgi:pimeloyl-ACP methyl ester carboxylesterase
VVGADHPAAVARFAKQLATMRPATALRVLRAVLTCDVRGVLPDVTAPCSIVHCGRDSVAPLAVARYMQRAMVACAGARGADTVVIESSGHFPQLAAPKEFVQAIEAVLIDH